MNDKTKREDFDKRLVLPNVMMKKNKIHSEMNWRISLDIYTHAVPPLLKLKKNMK